MRKLRCLSLILLLMAVFSHVSCTTEVEPIDPAVLNPDITSCSKPTSLQVSDFVNGTSINLNWIAGESETQWEIEYGPEGFTLGSGTSVIVDNTNYTVNGLDNTVAYQFYIRGVCSTSVFSDWVGPVGVNSASVDCVAPQNLSAVRNATDPTKVTVQWTAGADETQWKIQYGPTGFTIGSGTIVNATSTTNIISGLSTGQYDFYVMSACSATSTSNWVGPVAITSEPVTADYLYLNAKINGVTYTGLKPLLYPFVGATAKTTLLYGDNVLQVQGNTEPLNPSAPQSIEINLEIPRSLWHTGTYPLEPDADLQSDNPTAAMPNIIISDSSLTGNFASELEGGTITITEFNTATRRIKGTFSFSYETFSNEQGTQGPFQVTEGSFDFPIDPEVVF